MLPGLLVTRRLSLSASLLVQAEIRVLALCDVLAVPRLTLLLSLCVKMVAAAALPLRLRLGRGMERGEALRGRPVQGWPRLQHRWQTASWSGLALAMYLPRSRNGRARVAPC